MSKRSVPYDEGLKERLKNSEYAWEYVLELRGLYDAEYDHRSHLSAENSRLKLLLSEAETQMSKAMRLSRKYSDYKLYADEYFARALAALASPNPSPTAPKEGE